MHLKRIKHSADLPMHWKRILILLQGTRLLKIEAFQCEKYRKVMRINQSNKSNGTLEVTEKTFAYRENA